MTKGIIALDADGVLLDYGLAYASAWQKAFGTYPGERDPLADRAAEHGRVRHLAEPAHHLRAQRARMRRSAAIIDSQSVKTTEKGANGATMPPRT